MKKLALICICLIALACTTTAPPDEGIVVEVGESETIEPVEAARAAELGAWGVDLSTRDASVEPGDDFNRYANGAWMETFEIPPDLSSYSSFTRLRLEAEGDVRTIVEELASASARTGTLEQKVGDFYESWMDVERLDDLGASPLQPHLDRIAAIDDRQELIREMASLHNTAPFGIGIIPDPADTTRYVAFLGQSGLGMPNRDYYLKDDERFKQYRAAYADYITTVLNLAGLADAPRKADEIIELETELAEVWYKLLDLVS